MIQLDRRQFDRNQFDRRLREPSQPPPKKPRPWQPIPRQPRPKQHQAGQPRLSQLAPKQPLRSPDNPKRTTTAQPATNPRLRLIRLAALGLAVLAAALAGGILLAAAVGVLIAILRYRRKLARSRRQNNVVIADLAEVIDLFQLGISAGLTIWLTLEQISQLADNSLSQTLKLAVRKVNQGESLLDALDWLSQQHNHQLRLLTRPLIEAERYGIELTPSLARAAIEARQLRRRAGETAAKSVGVKLMFPLTLCILPAFALLTVVPQLASTFQLLQSSQT